MSSKVMANVKAADRRDKQTNKQTGQKHLTI